MSKGTLTIEKLTTGGPYIRAERGSFNVMFWKGNSWGFGITYGPYHFSLGPTHKDGWGNHSTYYREIAVRLWFISVYVAYGWLLSKPLGGLAFPDRDPHARIYWVNDADVKPKPEAWPEVVFEDILDADLIE